jgi:hypothetical protein
LDVTDLRGDLAPAASNAPAKVGPAELAFAEPTAAPPAALAALVVPAEPDGLTLAATDTWIIGAAFMTLKLQTACHGQRSSTLAALTRARPLPTGRNIHTLGIRIENDLRFASFELTNHSFDLLIEREFLFTIVGSLAQHE